MLAAAAALVLLGWLGIARAEEFLDTGGRFFRQQMVWSALALAALAVAMITPYRLLCRWCYPAFTLSLVLLAAVYWFPAVNGAHRWIRLGPVGMQPSEFAKLAFVLALARWLMYRNALRWSLLAPLAITAAPALLILREPDLGTALVFVPVMFAMLAVGGVPRGELLKLVAMGLLLLPVLWQGMSREQRSRVAGMFDQAAAGQRPTDDGYQLYQSKQMLSLGGWCGSLAEGDAIEDRAAYHLPEAHTDFIFAVLGERLGLAGTGGVLLLFALLIGRGVAVVGQVRDPFGRLVAAGIVALLAVQVLINTAMTVGLLPITGLSLPLVSYGGSGLLAHALALGLLLNVGRRAH
jgi:cell division protein FtsW (lipid II flippase)